MEVTEWWIGYGEGIELPFQIDAHSEKQREKLIVFLKRGRTAGLMK